MHICKHTYWVLNASGPQLRPTPCAITLTPCALAVKSSWGWVGGLGGWGFGHRGLGYANYCSSKIILLESRCRLSVVHIDALKV